MQKRIDRFASTLPFWYGLTVHISHEMFKTDRIARCDVSWTLCARYKHAFWCVFDRFQPTSLINTMRMHFRFDLQCGWGLKLTPLYVLLRDISLHMASSSPNLWSIEYYIIPDNHRCGLMNGAWPPGVDKERHGVSFGGDRTQISRDGGTGSLNMADSLTLFTDCEWGAVWRTIGLNIGAKLIRE